MDTEERSMLEAELAPARRLEIFTGAGRRRRWSPAQKAEILAESYAGASTISDVARRHGLSGAQLFAWRRQAREEQSASHGQDARFVPLMIAAGATDSGAGLAGAIVIEVAGLVLRVPVGLDPARVAALVRALRAAS